MSEERRTNSKTLRTQKLLSNKKFIISVLCVIDMVFVLLWNYLLNALQYLFMYGISEVKGNIGFYDGEHWFLCYAVLFLFIIVFDAVTAYRIYTSYSEEDINVGQKGKERWTTEEEIIQQYKAVPDRDKNYPGEPGTIISRIGNTLYLDTTKHNNLVYGITRSGKDEMFVFPSIDVYSRAEIKPSMVIADPKIESYRASKITLENRGYLVYLLNLDEPLYSMGYNPLDVSIRYHKNNEKDKAMATARSFAFSIFHSSADTSEPIWANTATDLFTALIIAHIDDALKEDEILNAERYEAFREKQKNYQEMDSIEQEAAKEAYEIAISIGNDVTDDNIHAIPEEETFWYINPHEKQINIYSIINLFTNLVRKKDESNPNLSALDLYFNQRPDLDIAKMKYATVESAYERTKGSIYTNMLSQLGVFIDENVAKMTTESSLDLKDLGFGKQPIAIFLGVPDYDKSNHFIASTFIRQAYYVNAKAATKKNGECDRAIKFILNEFGNMPPIEAMDELITVGAGRKITFDLYVQSNQQLSKLYKDDAQTIRDNCGNKIYIKSTDDNTLEDFVKMIGNETIVDVQRTGERLSLNKHVMETPTDKPLITINGLKNLREGECIIERSMLRRDREGKDITPYPIFNNIENGRRFLFRYQYLTDSFPNPKEILLQDVNTESREHIKLEERVYDYKKTFERMETQSFHKKILTFSNLQHKEAIQNMLVKALGDNYQEEFDINQSVTVPKLISFVSNNIYLPKEIKNTILGLIESEVS